MFTIVVVYVPRVKALVFHHLLKRSQPSDISCPLAVLSFFFITSATMARFSTVALFIVVGLLAVSTFAQAADSVDFKFDPSTANGRASIKSAAMQSLSSQSAVPRGLGLPFKAPTGGRKLLGSCGAWSCGWTSCCQSCSSGWCMCVPC